MSLAQKKLIVLFTITQHNSGSDHSDSSDHNSVQPQRNNLNIN